MLKSLFEGDYTRIDVEKNEIGGNIVISITDDLADHRKERIYINEDSLSTDLERFWDRVKRVSSKIKSIGIGFSEIDWYDNMTNIYNVPSFGISRGKRKVTVSHYETGSIPKAWEARIVGAFKPGRVKKPYMEFVNGILFLSADKRKEVEKALGKVLGGKSQYESIELTSD
jgi:hypothetical protein